MRTDIIKLIHEQSPDRPACFDTHEDWTRWLAGAHEAGTPVVRRVDTGKHTGKRETHFAVMPVGQQSHCVECPQARRDVMRAASRCFPVTPPGRKEPDKPASDGPQHRFELKGIATLERVRIDRRGPDEDRYLALVLKVMFAKVDAAVCAYFDVMLAPFLYRQELAGRVVRNQALRPIAYAHQIEGATVEIDRQTFHNSDVGSFAITPIDGTSVAVGCRIVIYPGKANCSDLIGRVKDGIRIRIVGPADLFDEPEDEPQPEAQASLAT